MAKKGKDKNFVSFWFWMFALFVVALPCIGFVMVIVWAFVGENETRKNYFRACIVWFLILTFFWGVLVMLGLSPLILKQFQIWFHQWQQ
jgi:hypothetical protein